MKNVYKEIVTLTDGPDQFVLNDQGYIKLRSKSFPWSIKEEEFDFIKSIIISRNLKYGFEIATGLGISAVAAGLGFKETSGKLVTMDSYIEELHNDYQTYRRSSPIINSDPIGYKCTNYLIDRYELKNVVFTELGWSPRDTSACLKKHFEFNQKLDFVFIDGGNFPEQVIRDVESLAPFLSNKYIILFHDFTPHIFDGGTMYRIRQIFNNKEPQRILTQNTSLGIIDNL